MKSVEKLEMLMRQNGHLISYEHLDVELLLGNGCITSTLINLGQLSEILAGSTDINWTMSLPELANLYSYFESKGRMFFKWERMKEPFKGHPAQARRFLNNRRSIISPQEIWIPATWAVRIYKAYATKKLGLLHDAGESIFNPRAA